MKLRRLLAPLLPLPIAASACADTAPACERVVFERVPMTVCSYPRDADIRIHQRRPDGTPLRRPEDVARHLGEGETLRMAMNGGMYHADLSPVGLYVEGGMEAAPLVTRAGPGNFGLVPNGVFWIGADGAHVTETKAYAALASTLSTGPDFATQSGPMLVVGGALHPRFLPNSTSLKIRNGVGVDADRVVFVKSEAPVNFHTFARYFRDEAKTPDALYLDGTVSRMWSMELGRSGRRFPLGPVIAVVE